MGVPSALAQISCGDIPDGQTDGIAIADTRSAVPAGTAVARKKAAIMLTS